MKNQNVPIFRLENQETKAFGLFPFCQQKLVFKLYNSPATKLGSKFTALSTPQAQNTRELREAAENKSN